MQLNSIRTGRSRPPGRPAPLVLLSLPERDGPSVLLGVAASSLGLLSGVNVGQMFVEMVADSTNEANEGLLGESSQFKPVAASPAPVFESNALPILVNSFVETQRIANDVEPFAIANLAVPTGASRVKEAVASGRGFDVVEPRAVNAAGVADQPAKSTDQAAQIPAWAAIRQLPDAPAKIESPRATVGRTVAIVDLEPNVVPEVPSQTPALTDGSAGPATDWLGPQPNVGDLPASETPTRTVETAQGESSNARPRVSASTAFNAWNPSTETGSFRVSRGQPSNADLPVQVTVQGFRGTESIASEQSAVIPRDASAVTVPVAMGQFEVATLTVREAELYRVDRPGARATILRATPGEAALFQAYRIGQSAEAFNALVERHRPAVFRTCRKVLGNWADAEDVSQFVFLMLARSDVRVAQSLAAWLRKVARNAAIAFLRSRSRRHFHERQSASDRVIEEPQFGPTDELGSALSQLPPPLREAVRLRYLEGLSQREAAERVGCPRGTLSQRAAHGIQRLRVILAGPVALDD